MKKTKNAENQMIKKKPQKNVYSDRVFVKLVNWSKILQK